MNYMKLFLSTAYSYYCRVGLFNCVIGGWTLDSLIKRLTCITTVTVHSYPLIGIYLDLFATT